MIRVSAASDGGVAVALTSLVASPLQMFREELSTEALEARVARMVEALGAEAAGAGTA
jgi:hypothetical protein